MISGNKLRISIALALLVCSLLLPSKVMASPDTETLRPSGAGDRTELTPSAGANWQCVDEASPDEDGSYVYTGSGDYDLYALSNHALTGVVTSVTVYARGKLTGDSGSTFKTVMKTGGNVYYGSVYSLSSSWTTRPSPTYTDNPSTGTTWTWDEVDALQAGVSLTAVSAAYCTQVYVVVDAAPFAAPTVTTQAVDNIAETTSTGHGTIVSTGGKTVSAWGVCWNTTGNPTTADSTAAGSGDGSVGAFTAPMTGLVAATLYYVKAYATNTEGTGYGSEEEFTTDGPPTITTNAATNVAYTTARLNSTLTDDGGEACEVRFQYYADGDPAWGEETAWTGSYTTEQQPYADIIDLTNNTLYHFRAQAKNSIATASGASTDFTTSNAVLEPTNFTAFPKAAEVPLSWTKSSGATDTYIRYSETAYPTAITEGTLVYADTSSSCSHEDLTPGHTYYYSAWGRSGVIYSDNYTTVMATTLATSAEDEAPDAPDMPPTWFQSPDYTVLSGLPLYGQINAAIEAFEMPLATGWFFATILGCVTAGLLTFAAAKDPIPVMVTLAMTFAMASLIKLLPMWMMLFTVTFMLGAWQFGKTK